MWNREIGKIMRDDKQPRVIEILPVHYANGLAKYLLNKKTIYKRVDIKKVEKLIVEFDNIQDIWHARTR